MSLRDTKEGWPGCYTNVRHCGGILNHSVRLN